MPENTPAKPAPQMTTVTSFEGGVAKVRCMGKLVAGVTGVLQAEVRSLLPESSRIVLDLSELSYMDSSGLGSIIGLYVSVKRAGGQLDVINLSPRVRQLFSLTNVLSLFEVCGEQNLRIP